MKGRQKGTPAPNKGKRRKPPTTTKSVRPPVSLFTVSKAYAQGLGMTWNRFAIQAIMRAMVIDPRVMQELASTRQSAETWQKLLAEDNQAD